MSRMKSGLLAGAVVLLLIIPARAANISGFVRDESSGESLPFVSVYLKDQNRGGVSNESGYYAIANVLPGRYTLLASLVGYQLFEQEVSVDEENLVIQIRMQERVIEMETTVIQAERETARSLDISPGRTTLQIRELKAAPAAIEADPMRTIQTLPGVSTLSDFSVGLYVRGGTPDQNLILLDGTDVYNPDHLFGLFSTFPADAAKSTELLRGGYPAKYGGRLSSVLNVITNEGNKEKFEATGGVGLLSSRLTVQGPVGKGSYLLSGRRTHLEPILKIAREALDAERFDYNFYDLQGKTHQVLSHEDQVTLAAYKGRDNLVYRFEEFDLGLDWGNRTLSAKWTHLFDSALFGNFMYTGSRFDAHTRFDTEDVRLQEDNLLIDHSFKGDLSYFPHSDHTVEAGLLIKRMSMEYLFGEADQQWVNVKVSGFHHAVYLQDNWRVTPLLALQPGLRFNYFDNGNYTGWSPRLSARYQTGDDTFIKGAVGVYHQYIFRLSRDFQGISLLSNIWALADSTAAPSKAIHYIAGFDTRVASLELDVEVYYKDYTGLYELNYEEAESVRIGDLLRRGDGEAYGLDVMLRKRAGRHTGWLSLSTGVSQRTIAGLNLDEQDRERSFRSKFDRRVSFDLVHSWRFRKRWNLNTRLAYASGQPYTQVLGRGEIELPSGSRWTFNYPGELNALRLPAYGRLDLAMQRRFAFRSWDLTAYVQAVNATNRKNLFNYFWENRGKPENRQPAKRREIRMLPVLPSFGIDFHW